MNIFFGVVFESPKSKIVGSRSPGDPVQKKLSQHRPGDAHRYRPPHGVGLLGGTGLQMQKSSRECASLCFPLSWDRSSRLCGHRISKSRNQIGGFSGSRVSKFTGPHPGKVISWMPRAKCIARTATECRAARGDLGAVPKILKETIASEYHCKQSCMPGQR